MGTRTGIVDYRLCKREKVGNWERGLIGRVIKV